MLKGESRLGEKVDKKGRNNLEETLPDLLLTPQGIIILLLYKNIWLD